jgi:TraX protein
MVRTFDFGREILKIVAIATMTMDHVGAIFYPELVLFRVVGRIAFPLFAYLITLGIEDTKKPGRYIITIFFFALISQIPYSLAFKFQPFEQLNILFPLCLSALALYVLNKKSLETFLLILPLAILLSVFLNMEGNFYVILSVCCMKLLRSKPLLGSLSLVGVNLLVFQTNQLFSLLALPLILLHEKDFLKKEISIPDASRYYTLRKYAFYIYYPLHLGMLYLVNLFFF